MRLLVDLTVTADTEYDHTYHNKLQGRVWGALRDTPYDDAHDDPTPLGLSYSNPYPPGQIFHEGERKHLLFAAPDEQLLGHIADDLTTHPELNIGEMQFTVDNIRTVDPEVGPIGSTGTLETETGVVVRIPPEDCEQYGLPTTHDTDTFWRKEHSMKPFKENIKQNLAYKHDLFGPDSTPSPTEMTQDLFDEYMLRRQFALPVTVTTGVEQTYILSQWTFKYTVRTDAHREYLNLLLDTGIGERNGLGFGFLNPKTEDTASNQTDA